MKNLYLLIVLLNIPIFASAQVLDTSAAWAFMGGATTVGANTSVPTTPTNTYDPTHRPRNRQYTHLWVDQLNRIWVFGGSGGGNQAIVLNDLWVYDPSRGTNGEWRWVRGSGENGKHTGTVGQSATSNIPAARHQGLTWKTSDGYFWLFGGQQIFATSYTSPAYGNDLWKFNPVSEEWVWVNGEMPSAAGAGGTKTGIYPTQVGQEGMPRGRGWSASTVDPSGNLWLYGGSTNGIGSGFMSDVWKFDVAAGKWFLMWGDATPDLQPNYNGQTMPGTPGGHPGGRHSFAFWSDAQGNIWIYGGHGSTHFFSDLWKFDIVTMQWTWMSGSNKPSVMPPQNNSDGNGFWGDRGVASVDRYPGKRYGMASFKDKLGRFWLHGGRAASGTGSGLKNDLWMFDPQTLRWTWMEGDSLSDLKGIAGAEGVQDPAYLPSARISIGSGVVDTAFNFWIIGGHGLGMVGNNAARNFIGDVWNLTPTTPPTCTLTASLTASGPLSFCEGDSLLLRANKQPGVSYKWMRGSTVLSETEDSIWVKSSGSYSVTLKDQICEVSSLGINVTVNSLPVVTTVPSSPQWICPGDSILLKVAPAGHSYQWTKNGIPFGQNADSIKLGEAATIGVKVTNPTTGCADTLVNKIVVSLHNKPIVNLNQTGQVSICENDSINLQVTTAQVGFTYQWYRNGVPLSGANSQIRIADPGIYNVKVTEPVNGCYDTASAPLSLVTTPLPIVTISPSSVIEICQGEQVQLTATASGSVQYQWKHNGVPFGSNNATATVGTSGDYYVVATDANQCSDSSSVVELLVRSVPVFTINPWNDTSFCFGEKILYQVQTNDTGLKFQWIRDGAIISAATLDFYEVSASGKYQLAVQWASVAGCGDTSSMVEVTVFPLPVPNIQYDGVKLFSDSGYTSYKWYSGEKLVGEERVFYPLENGSYRVQVVDSNGCEGESSIYNVKDLAIENKGAKSLSDVSIYPNPVRESRIYFNYSSPVNYRLFSVEGKLLFQGFSVGEADVSGLSDGIYLIEISDDAGQILKTTRLVRHRD